MYNPSKTGYEFKGWYSAETGGYLRYSASDTGYNEFTISLSSSNNEAYARFEILDNSAPTVTITRTNYKTFSWTASSNTTIKGYQVTNTDEPWSTWTSANATSVSGTYSVGNGGTWTVFAKDANGNIGSASITSYNLTRTQGANTTLTIKEGSSSGTTISSSVGVLSGTTIYIEASAGSGYNASITVDGNPFDSGNTKVITADTTVVSSATQNTYTITLDNQSATNAGTTSLTEKYGDGIYNGSNRMTTSSNPITKPTKTGYTFGGYYTQTNGNGTQMINESGYITSNFTSTYFNSNSILYAKWTKNVYGIHLVPTMATTAGTEWIYETYGEKYSLTNGGNAMTTSSNPIEKPKREYEVTYNYNGATGGNSEASKKAEYTFKGYYKYSNGEGTQYIGSNGYLTSSASNTDFTSNGSIYADWTPTSITLPTPTKTGYAFGGWYSNSSLTTFVGTEGASYTPEEDITLYAKWTQNTYTITLNNQSATSAGTGTIYETYGVKYSLTSGGNAMTTSANAITVPQRKYTVTYNYNGATGGNQTASSDSNYTFGGYYTSTNGGGTQYIGTTGYLTSSASNTNFSSNGSLYAKWTSASVTLPTPTKTGYTFGGWYSDSSLSTSAGASGASYTPTSNITLYAKWTQSTFTITLDNANAKRNGTSTIYEKYATGIYLDSSCTTQMTTSTNPITKPERAYTVTYNYNGSGQANGSGTATYGFNGYYDGTTQMINGEGKLTNSFTSTQYSSAKTLNAKWTDGNVILPTPNDRSGFTFEGWYKEASLTNRIGNAGASYVPTTNTTIYAKWTDTQKPEVTITRDTYNKFTWTASDNVGVTGYQITTSNTQPSATGSGWITSGTLTTGQKTIDIDSGKTYYVWAKDAAGNVSDAKSITAYTLTKTQGANTTLKIQENNASGAEIVNTQPVLEGTTIYVTASANTGYTLTLTVGGNDFESGNTKQITANTEVKSTAKASIYTITLDNSDATMPGTSKIYERYADAMYSESGLINKMTTSNNPIVIPERKYIVTYDYNGSGQENGIATAIYGFDGYYDGTTKMIDENGYITSIFTNTYFTSQKTLNAKWTDGSVTLSTPDAREGYTFRGWYKDVACTDANKVGDAGEEYVPTEDITLYGKWEINQYTLTVNPYGEEYTQDYKTTIDVYSPEVKITLKFEDGRTDDEEITAEFKQWGLTGGMPSGGIDNQTSDPVTYTYGASDAVLTAYYNRITMQRPTKVGYTFDGWYTEEEGGEKEAEGNDQYEPTETKTLYAHWIANTDTPYKVEHYLQKPDGTYPSIPFETENKTGTTDTEVTAVAKSYDGYTEDEENENRIASGNVNGDGSQVLKLYYLANTDTPYTVEYYLQNLDGNGYTKDEDATEHKEGITGDLTAAEEKIYLGFLAKDFDQEEIKGNGNTLIKIYYDRCLDTPYTVRHYLQNVDNEDEYTIDNNATEQKAGKTGDLTEAEAKEYPGFEIQEFEQQEIEGDGSTVVNIYYNRRLDTPYTVEYYLQNVEDDEYTQDEEAREEKEGKTGAYTEVEAKEYEGFALKTLEQEEINGDGSTVVRIYYDRQLKTVTFKNYNGVTLETKTVRYEGNIEYTGATPIKDKAGYTCTFIGWNRDLEYITEDTEIIAEFSEEAIVYTIDYKQISMEGVEFERENPTTYTVETEDFTLCNPTAEGFTFVGWRLEGQKNVEEEVTIQKGSIGNRIYETIWRANDDTPYKVEYYKQQENGTYSEEPEEVEELTGTTLDEVKAEEKEYEGYELDKEKSITEGMIKGDGSLVLKLYYKKIPEKTEEPTKEEPTQELPAETNKNSNIVTKTYTTNTDNTMVSKVIPKTGGINILLIISIIIVTVLGIVLVVKEKKAK